MRTVLRPFSHKVEHASGLFKQPGRLFYILMGLMAVSILTGCGSQQKIKAPQDKPLAAYQTELLDLAFETATMIPVNPHIKDQSKAQAAVATVCFQLDQPQRALGYIEKIGDWRRGAGYADYAFYCAQQGFTNDVQRYLNLAEQISLIADQDWRRDRIKVRISQTHLLLGQTERSEQFSSNLEKSESGKAEQVGAMMCAGDEFDTQTGKLDALIAIGDFELTKNTLQAYAQLYDRFYDDVLRRTVAEEKVKGSWTKIPYTIRLDLLSELADFSLKHADQTNALRLVNNAGELLAKVDLPAEYRIPIMARLAGLRFRSGDEATACSAAADLLTFYTEHQSEIINIDKAETLCPVAEALQTMGDIAAALAVYRRAVEAAVENPNSRPRAEDLSAICLSMAKQAVEPDAALLARICEIKSALGEPW